MQNRKKLLLIGIAFVLLLVISCLIVHSVTKSNCNAKITALAESGLSSAIIIFSEYDNSGYESDYWSGVASYKQYLETARQVEYDFEGMDLAVYQEGNTIYGVMILSPECAREHLSDVITTLKTIREDITALDVHLRLAELKNALVG